jgi:hypothetical protein
MKDLAFIHWSKTVGINHLNKTKSEKHKIARIIISNKQYESLPNNNYIVTTKPIFLELKNVVNSFVEDSISKNMKFEFIVTQGGFLTFEWPKEFSEMIDEREANKKSIFFINLLKKKLKNFLDL